MTSEKRILCVGLCCLDIVMICDSFPEEDSDQRCRSHTWQLGGNASNNVKVISEFKVPCEILGTLGLDIGGQFLKEIFASHGVSTEHCHFYEDYESPTSIILINAQNGSRTIAHSNKDMPEVTFEDFRNLDLTMYSWIHFEVRPYYKNILTMIDHIRKWNIQESSEPIKISIEIEKPKTELVELLSLSDIVFISKDFAAACGYEDMVSAVESLCHKLRPGAALICAWGDKGACAKTAEGPLHVSKAYPPPKIENTLGAGDTFVAATIISLAKGRELSEAIGLGCQVAGTKCGLSDVSSLGQLCPYL